MKSQVHYLLQSREKNKNPGALQPFTPATLTEQDLCDIAYEFQEAVVEVLAKKTIRAAIQYNAKTIGIV